MTEYIDTHAHPYDEAYGDEAEEMIGRCLAAGVTKIISADVETKTRQAMFSQADRHPGVIFPCLGLHPTCVDANWEKEYEDLLNWTDKKVWAIGEVGIDCHWSAEFLEEQKKVMKLQFELAHKLNLPVIIHSRDATAITLDVLRECRHLDLRGVFHAFSGSAGTFHELEKYGLWYVGIGGVITFKKASIAETVKDIPLERILLETDAPYLAPTPHRGTRNESSYIPLVAEKLALQKGVCTEEVAAVTTANAETLFALKGA